jgi:hypothetical protein
MTSRPLTFVRLTWVASSGLLLAVGPVRAQSQSPEREAIGRLIRREPPFDQANRAKGPKIGVVILSLLHNPFAEILRMEVLQADTIASINFAYTKRRKPQAEWAREMARLSPKADPDSVWRLVEVAYSDAIQDLRRFTTDVKAILTPQQVSLLPADVAWYFDSTCLAAFNPNQPARLDVPASVAAANSRVPGCR